ncbi:Uncharacterised protein [Mycobacteroides abscessus subsp. bolletii]|nr:Uncharacterised protein [Mycobacteroides abscessus subsp. bolletii]
MRPLETWVSEFSEPGATCTMRPAPSSVRSTCSTRAGSVFQMVEETNKVASAMPYEG